MTDQRLVHRVPDGLPVAEDLGEVPGAEHVPQRGGGQQPGGPVVVVVVADRAQGVGHLAQEGQLAIVRVLHSVHLVVDHGVHVDGDAVPGEDLLRRHVECPGPEVR